MRHKHRVAVLFSCFALACCCCVELSGQPQKNAQRESSQSKAGLHATLKAEHGWYGDNRLETLTFRLMNDSDETLDSATSSWVLVIDDKQAPDPGGQLWMGGKPTGGYDIVRPGTTYQFGKGLSLRQYFPEARDYKVYWKAAGFRSNVVVVRGQAAR
ncbi:hypothetical protein HDF16_006163 [Granulicella aggregans]|uniref:Secreted protein n=1 Tax=Granulicella aggregans TaxID=474949 RepID=A0A7W8E778_9BACT|nr:hypothetical protein [Granulicella aggregans]MBB5061427.1 hypothetical protein [Granulicella aggregans]